jgi:hypothetical protein
MNAVSQMAVIGERSRIQCLHIVVFFLCCVLLADGLPWRWDEVHHLPTDLSFGDRVPLMCISRVHIKPCMH